VREISIPFGEKRVAAFLPKGSEILHMAAVEALADPAAELVRALSEPIGAPPLALIARELVEGRRRTSAPGPRACIVVSDSTRPVPYAGPGGILLPILRVLLDAGFPASAVDVLVATGTHRPMGRDELATMLGPEALALGVHVVNHDCRDEANLVDIGRTSRGTRARINRLYARADLKILTGLVESHFMAGASGGRKAICPGILGEEGTHVFHSAALMAHPLARDLVLEGNPVHEESLAVARMAGADFIVNVTLDGVFRTTGIFAGSLEAAHEAAVAKLRSYVGIPLREPFDLVVTHGGHVGLNHYQAAKAAVAALGALKQGGGLILVADNHDPGPVGSDRYRTLISLLKLVGPEAFDRILASPDWTFVPEQWQVQMWAKVFKKIAMRDFTYFAPQLDDRDWRDLPGRDGGARLSPPKNSAPDLADSAAVVAGAVQAFLTERGFTSADLAEGRCRVAYLADGPYGIPYAVGESENPPGPVSRR